MSDIIEYKCPACGGAMVFDSKSQHMKCPYCDTEMTVEEFQRTQKSEDTQTDSEENWHSMSTGEWQNERSMVCVFTVVSPVAVKLLPMKRQEPRPAVLQ